MHLATMKFPRLWRKAAGVAACLFALASLPAPVRAVTLGFHDRFNDGTTGTWSSGAGTSNPGTGGLTGDGDGFLLISVGPFAGNLGAFSSSSDYAGNWTAAGVTQVRLWLKDVGTHDALEMHVCVGNGLSGNFWQSNTGLIPPTTGWQQFTVDVTNAGNFTFIGSVSGNFTTAMQNVDRLLVRHDHAPYGKVPDTIIGDVGIDDVLLTNGTAGVGDGDSHVAVGAPVRLAPPAPNPSHGAVAFRIEAPAGEPVHVQVVDPLGRVVRHDELLGTGGSLLWNWDGANDAGARMAPGYYRMRAWSRFGGMSQPVVRID